MRLGTREQAARFKVPDDLRPRFETVQAPVALRRVAVHPGVGSEHADPLQRVAFTDLVVVEIVGGVIFTQPVPNSGSTISSAMTGMRRSVNGSSHHRTHEITVAGVAGWTATAVSPSIVSGRVVATSTQPAPSARG